MFVGICTLDLVLAENHSLKGKRQVLRRVRDRVRNTFNVAIAEVDELDSWHRSTIALACVSREKSHVDSQLSQILNFLENLHVAEIENVHVEIL